MTYFYLMAISLVLLGYVFCQHVCGLRCPEQEIRSLEQVELHLAHILRLLEAPDVRLLMEMPSSRQSLLLEFSECLKQDVTALVRLRALGMTSLIWVGIFFAGYYTIRLKALLRCGRKDLRFLCGLELALLRTVL